MYENWKHWWNVSKIKDIVFSNNEIIMKKVNILFSSYKSISMDTLSFK